MFGSEIVLMTSKNVVPTKWLIATSRVYVMREIKKPLKSSKSRLVKSPLALLSTSLSGDLRRPKYGLMLLLKKVKNQNNLQLPQVDLKVKRQ